MRNARRWLRSFVLPTLLCAGCQTHQRLVLQDEQVIVNDLRALLSAQSAYEAANLGFPDTLRCLGSPQACIAAYPKDAPPFLSAALANLVTENGYARAFYPGPPASRDACPAQHCSASSLSRWAYTAVPTSDRRKRKSYCVDSARHICAVADGSPPAVVDGQCPSPCERIH